MSGCCVAKTIFHSKVEGKTRTENKEMKEKKMAQNQRH